MAKSSPVGDQRGGETGKTEMAPRTLGKKSGMGPGSKSTQIHPTGDRKVLEKVQFSTIFGYHQTT